jgi:hypothetical protein
VVVCFKGHREGWIIGVWCLGLENWAKCLEDGKDQKGGFNSLKVKLDLPAVQSLETCTQNQRAAPLWCLRLMLGFDILCDCGTYPYLPFWGSWRRRANGGLTTKLWPRSSAMTSDVFCVAREASEKQAKWCQLLFLSQVYHF